MTNSDGTTPKDNRVTWSEWVLRKNVGEFRLQGGWDGNYIAIPLSLTIIVSRFPHGYGSKAVDTQMMEQTGGNMHCQKEGSMFDIAQLPTSMAD